MLFPSRAGVFGITRITRAPLPRPLFQTCQRDAGGNGNKAFCRCDYGLNFSQDLIDNLRFDRQHDGLCLLHNGAVFLYALDLIAAFDFAQPGRAGYR